MKNLKKVLRNKRNLSISVFFPCYNDAQTIGKLVKNSFAVLKELTKNYEVIVVDDGSLDNSRQILQELANEYRQLKLIYHHKNQGYGGALQSGFRSAVKDLIFYTDGDGQYDVKELPVLLSLMTSDVNFINGIKMSRQDPNYRIIIGNFYSLIARWLFWLPVYDVDCDFRLIRRSLIRKITLKNNSGAVCIELIKKSQGVGAKFRQVSVHHYRREWGESQFFQFNHLLSTFKELFSLWLQLMVGDKIKKVNFFK